jgi:diadenosine tetraphosphate (Ap4A) HIT family hydrolase
VAVPHPQALTPCHVAVAPRRHVATFYELDVQEQHMVWNLVNAIREKIMTSLHLEGCDVGFADAGPEERNGPHAHVHVVPRRPGLKLHLPSGIEWVNVDLK